MEQIREAFNRVKEDIHSLRQENYQLRDGLVETRESLTTLIEVIKQTNLKTNNELFQLRDLLTKMDLKLDTLKIPLNQQKEQTIPSTYPLTNTTNSLILSTDLPPLDALNQQNMAFSTGNQGVPTDRQTHRQTHRQTDFQENSIDNAADILDSLDSIKKEIRLKFKRLTEQEMLIFSTLYQLEEENGYSDYKTLAKKLKLTESSIRDYVGRLIKKGIPVEKKKINNKSINLSVSNNLKKIVKLPTILQLRDL